MGYPRFDGNAHRSSVMSADLVAGRKTETSRADLGGRARIPRNYSPRRSLPHTDLGMDKE